MGAIALTLGDVSERDDLPALTESFEVIGSPGLFLAGEVTGYALVRTAITHGVSVAEEIARRVRAAGNTEGSPSVDAAREDAARVDDRVLDLAIVGAGPAGLACALSAKEQKLDAITIDQESLGGTVARYPRRKLVLTHPVTLPIHGRLKQTSIVKEELVDLWQGIATRAGLRIRTGVTYRGLSRDAAGVYALDTSIGAIRARHVVLALGRRGSPRKLGVPGEELTKVGYSLLDAQSYRDRHLLVVGGGDSAVEAAVGLSEQPGNTVTLSYRKSAFSRIKAANERWLNEAVAAKRITLALDSQVREIHATCVDLEFGSVDSAAANGVASESRVVSLPNDDVFIFAGGIAPFQLLEESGVSFAPEDRQPVAAATERGPGIVVALTTALALAVLVIVWAVAQRGYYGLGIADRTGNAAHDFLRAAGPVGLAAGVLAIAAMVWNLAYLVRRAPWGQWIPGALSFWMSSHVLTGVVALLAVLVHSGFSARSSVGGHAFLCMTIVVGAGAVGRYLYSFVPRAANGRELDLDEVRAEFERLSLEWDGRGSSFGMRARQAVETLVERDRWQRTFVGRLRALLTSERRVRRELARLRAEGASEGFTRAELNRWLALARRAHRSSLAVAHYEDLRAILGTWRYLHRWLALLLVLFVGAHVVTAVRYADFSSPANDAPNGGGILPESNGTDVLDGSGVPAANAAESHDASEASPPEKVGRQ